VTATREELEQVVADLAARLERVEDGRDITRLLTLYGFAVDVGDADATTRLYTEDTVIDLGPGSQFEGLAGARQLVLDQRHQAIVGRCAHTVGPLVVDVDVDGDHASAAGYVRVYVSDSDTGDPELWHVSYTRFELVRSGTSWRIAARRSRALGADDAVELLRPSLSSPDLPSESGREDSG
jgi:ketosteroid isomerase-like protein